VRKNLEASYRELQVKNNTQLREKVGDYISFRTFIAQEITSYVRFGREKNEE